MHGWRELGLGKGMGMGNGKWEIGNGKWEMGNGNGKVPRSQEMTAELPH